MKKFYIIFSFVLIFILLSFYFFYSKTFVLVKFSSKHPKITVSETESKLFNLYANLFLQIKSRSILDVKPNLIGIIYTDKIRPDNKVIDDGRKEDFGATINIMGDNEVLIYIFVSDNIINNEHEDKIKEYTLDTIRFYQGMEKGNRLFLNFIKLPINVN